LKKTIEVGYLGQNKNMPSHSTISSNHGTIRVDHCKTKIYSENLIGTCPLNTTKKRNKKMKVTRLGVNMYLTQLMIGDAYHPKRF
jgi:hypothetical protein